MLNPDLQQYRENVLPLLKALEEKLRGKVVRYTTECNNRYESGIFVSNIIAHMAERYISTEQIYTQLNGICIKAKKMLNTCYGTFAEDVDNIVIMLMAGVNTDYLVIAINIILDAHPDDRLFGLPNEEYFDYAIENGMLSMSGELLKVEKPKQYVHKPVMDDIYQM